MEAFDAKARHDAFRLRAEALEEARDRVRQCPHPTFGQLALKVTQPLDLETSALPMVTHLRLCLDPQVFCLRVCE